MLFSSNCILLDRGQNAPESSLSRFLSGYLPRKNKLRLQWVCLLQQHGAIVAADFNGETAQVASRVHIGDAIGRQITGEDQHAFRKNAISHAAFCCFMSVGTAVLCTYIKYRLFFVS